MNVPDHIIIHRHGYYTVLRQAHTVSWRSGRSIELHVVYIEGHLAPFLRCLLADQVHAMVFDVRDLCAELETELPGLPQRDAQAVVERSLRAHFADAPACVNKVAICRRAAWLVAPPHAGAGVAT